MLSRSLIAALALANTALAQGPLPSPMLASSPASSPEPKLETAPTSLIAPELSRADVEPFLDGLINSQLANRDIAGAVISIVKDGEVLLAKGYGFADFEHKRAVVADETLFRPGSISKLFTATAVLQLFEAGKLDLDRDVRDYLDFDIPRRFPEPISLRRILTHTAGFEESLKDLLAPGEHPIPLREYVVTHIPTQIFRPGAVPAYSNYALSLAGYIVERMSGESFADYIDRHILTPLALRSSTFIQPLPDALKSQMSNGYNAGSAGAKIFEICNASPAGALSATATDMTRFMLAMLNGGTLGDATILQPSSVQMMQSRQNELHPELHAMGFGFMEESENGHTIWGHGGDSFYFHSDLFLIPDAHVGFFLSYNSTGNRPGGLRAEVQRAFLDRYFPKANLPLGLTSDAATHGREVSGVYEMSRRSETNELRLTSLAEQVSVSADPAGVVTIENARNIRGQLKRWREVAPYLYREIDGPDRLAFRRDANGKVTEMLTNVPILVGQRVNDFRSKAVLFPLVGASLAFIAATLLLWPVAAVVRKRYSRSVAPDATTRWLHRLSRLVALLIFGMIMLLLVPLTRVQDDVGFAGAKANPWLIGSHVCGWLACIGLLVVFATAARYWRTAGVRWWPRVHSTLFALATLVFLCFAWQWHMLSPSLKF